MLHNGILPPSSVYIGVSPRHSGLSVCSHPGTHWPAGSGYHKHIPSCHTLLLPAYSHAGHNGKGWSPFRSPSESAGSWHYSNNVPPHHQFPSSTCSLPGHRRRFPACHYKQLPAGGSTVMGIVILMGTLPAKAGRQTTYYVICVAVLANILFGFNEISFNISLTSSVFIEPNAHMHFTSKA